MAEGDELVVEIKGSITDVKYEEGEVVGVPNVVKSVKVVHNGCDRQLYNH